MMEKKPRIMIVDDDEQVLRLVESVLRPLNAEVVKAMDGVSARDLIFATPPDLVITDINMPKLDGIELCVTIKNDTRTSGIPVVIVTGLDQRDDRLRGIKAGADDFLTKPFDASELILRARNLLKIKEHGDFLKNYNEILEKKVAERTREIQTANENLERTNVMLHRSYLDTVYRLSVAVELRDDDTGVHIKRMGRVAAAVAREMGLPPEDVERILCAAPMHDVGKIGVPDHILLKPGKFSPEEWVIMRTHTIMGAKILAGSDSKLIQTAEIIAGTHHEQWSGNGYPSKLAGEAIPLEGRITAIADVFDALISKRPYKEAFSMEKSFEIIMEGRGLHFDPNVTDAFFRIKDEITGIVEKHVA